MHVIDPLLTVSIVSHGHGAMVSRLVEQLLRYSEVMRVVVTCNIPEQLSLPDSDQVQMLLNPQPKGFAANHNAAFAYCTTPWFVVLNPDVELPNNPFPAMLHAARGAHVGVASPAATTPLGQPEDNWRRFPTVWGLARKVFGLSDGRYRHPPAHEPPFAVDWVSGLCMLFNSSAYTQLKGFDERYFLYYEDVDVCVRAWKAGWQVVACPGATVVHQAQRASHRNMQHLRWHLASMARYFATHAGRLPAADYRQR